MTTTGSCMDPKQLIIKVVAPNGCIDRPYALMGQIGLVSHHSGSLWGVIELHVLCAFVCRVGYFDAQIKETLSYK